MSNDNGHIESERELNNLFNSMFSAIDAGDFNKIQALTEDGKPLEIESPKQPEIPEVKEQPEEPSGEEPKASEEDTPENQTHAVEDPEQPKSENEDWIDAIPEEHREKVLELRNANKDLDSRLKSQLGRIPSLQRDLALLKQELARQKERRREEPKAPKKIDPAELLGNDDDPQFKALKENDPDFANFIRKREEKLLGAMDKMLDSQREQQVRKEQDIEAERHREILRRETDLLIQAVPNAFEVFESDGWNDWISNAPEDIQRVAQSATDHRSVIRLLQLYDMDMRMMEQYQKEQEKGKEPKKEEAPQTPNKLQQQREERLNKGGISKGTPAIKPEAPLDERALFEKFYNQA